MQTCNYSNSDDESACWVIAQNNNLERFVTYIFSFFSSDSGITFALQFVGRIYSQIKLAKQDMIIFI